MKKYFQNLWAAICGKNVYLSEFDLVSDELMQTKSELAQALLDLATATEEVKEMSKKYDECWQNTMKMNGQVDTLNQLVENYRDRISEKDVLMERQRQDYQQRIAEYVKEIDNLKNH